MEQQTDHKSNELRTEKISVLLRKYSIPSIVSMIVIALYNIVDRIYIGQGVGPMAISGLTLTLPVTTLITAIGTLVGVGASARISIVLGMKDTDWARNILGHVPVLSLILSALFIVPTMLFMDPILLLFGGSEQTIPYAREYLMVVVPFSIFTNICYGLSNVMRATGFPKKSMITVLIGVLLNVVLDPIFIFGLDMGIRGAAVATAISMFVGALYGLAHFLNPKHEVSLRWKSLLLRRNIVRNIISIGFSPFIMNLIGSAIAIIVNTQLRRYGGDLAIGSFGIINSYQLFISFIVMGICQGMQPIIGYNYGANNVKRVKDTFFLAARLSTYVYVGGFVLTEILTKYAVMVFTNNEELIALTITGMRITFAACLTIGMQIVISQYFVSVSKAMKAVVLSTSRQMLFLIPLLLVFPRIWGLNGIWIAIPVSDFLAFILAVIFINGERKRIYRSDRKMSLRALVARK